MLQSFEYLGHSISEKGLQPTGKKVKSVPAPTNLTQLQLFLELMNYYCKFLPNIADTLSHFHGLLQRKVQWKLGKEQHPAFETAKSQLTTDHTLICYDPSKPIIMACDASPYSLGVVISHKLSSGEEKPIAFASCSLVSAEKQYSQLEKEALAIAFGLKRFRQYLYGHPLPYYLTTSLFNDCPEKLVAFQQWPPPVYSTGHLHCLLTTTRSSLRLDWRIQMKIS